MLPDTLGLSGFPGGRPSGHFSISMATDERSDTNILDRMVAERPRLAPVMYAMWGRAEGRRLGRDQRKRAPVTVLKGPELQERLYGTPAAYQSS